MIDQLITVFVIEDDEFFASLIHNKLNQEGDYDVKVFEYGKEALNNMNQQPDIVVIDYSLPDINGIDLLKKIKEINPEVSCVVLSGQKELQVVVEAYKIGAERYIMKDENAIIELCQNLSVISEKIQLKNEIESLKSQIIERNRYQNIIGQSPAMMNMFKLMQKVENIKIPVLVTGDNGSGKELVANALHYNSDRKRRPFVAVNVAAIPEDLVESELFGSEKGAFTGAVKRIGKFEEAHRGTIFLDEIGELDLSLQAKLLRVLQEKSITRLGGAKEISLDIKIISATNKNLWQEVQKGNFREDLYFRLQGFLIQLPPLRDRGNDIILLAQHFIKKFVDSQGLSNKNLDPQAIAKMLKYSWPGNVRELKSMVERACLICDGDTIEISDLIFLEQQPRLSA
jgi:DNA-binding NtrC family response regulator